MSFGDCSLRKPGPCPDASSCEVSPSPSSPAPVTAPAAAQMLVGDGSVKCGGPYVISSGDTLSRVSERAYGDPMLYGILADANWDALGGDPEHLTVGMSITIPCIDANGKA